MTNVIVCANCGERLFRCEAVGRQYAGTTIRAEDMMPVSKEVPAPKDGDGIVCPLCNELYGIPVGKNREDGLTFVLEDGTVWPQVPPYLVKQGG